MAHVDIAKLVKDLEEHAEWAEANEWESPITLAQDILMATKILRLFESPTRCGCLPERKAYGVSMGRRWGMREEE